MIISQCVRFWLPVSGVGFLVSLPAQVPDNSDSQVTAKIISTCVSAVTDRASGRAGVATHWRACVRVTWSGEIRE